MVVKRSTCKPGKGGLAMTRRSYLWLLCAVSLLLTLRSVYQIGKTLLAGGMTGLLPNAILLVCLIAVDGYLLWSALRAAPAVEAPPSPGQKAPLCRVGWTCLRILAAAGLLVLFLKDLLPRRGDPADGTHRLALLPLPPLRRAASGAGRGRGRYLPPLRGPVIKEVI